MNDTAPFFADMADGPPDGRAHWLTADDGVRIRVAHWNKDGASNGTVFLFPGRTEYIEKYGRAARDLAQRGFCTFAIDWRGQGLADRLTADPMAGHVGTFDDYQRDVAAMVAQAGVLALPKPWVLLGHSMGGCIALRAVYNDMPVQSVVFSGPMFGIRLAPALRPAAWAAAWLGTALGLGHHYAPSSGHDAYVLTEAFEGNNLTRDRDMWDYMIDHVQAQPGLRLGGPSLRWLQQALRECRTLAAMPAPDIPGLTILGTDEKIVDIPRIHARMQSWPNGTLLLEEAGRHEVLMEDPATRTRLFDRIAEHYTG